MNEKVSLAQQLIDSYHLLGENANLHNLKAAFNAKKKGECETPNGVWMEFEFADGSTIVYKIVDMAKETITELSEGHIDVVVNKATKQ